MCEERFEQDVCWEEVIIVMASFLFNVFIFVVCSVPCVYSLVYISVIAIPWGNVLPYRQTSAYSYDSAFGFQIGFSFPRISFTCLNRPGWCQPCYIWPIRWSSAYWHSTPICSLFKDAPIPTLRGDTMAAYIYSLLPLSAWHPAYFQNSTSVVSHVLFFLFYYVLANT